MTSQTTGSTRLEREQEASVAQIINGRYTARMDEPSVMFIIGMWLPLHKDPAAVERRMIRARSASVPHYVPTVQLH
jgi:hypothetical protein